METPLYRKQSFNVGLVTSNDVEEPGSQPLVDFQISQHKMSVLVKLS